MGDGVVIKVLRQYGIDQCRLLAMQKGYRNESHPCELPDGRRVNLILYKTEPGIRGRIGRANAVADYLAAHGLPARHTIDPRIIRLRAGGSTKYGALYAYLDGETIPWEAYTKNHLKALGQAMGDMHGLLQGYPGALNHTVTNEYRAILEHMERYFGETAVQEALQRKLGLSINTHTLPKLRGIVEKCATLPGQQPLHMDFVRSNILFAPDGHITGILDFEKTALGHPLFDIARTLAFLLVDCKYKPEAKVRKYFLHSGYNKRGQGKFKVTAGLAPLLERLLDLFLLYDFYKFLRHNPYEFLHQNEHYTRTARQLQARGILSPGGA